MYCFIVIVELFSSSIVIVGGRWGGVDVSLVLIPRSASDESAWHEVMVSQMINMCIALNIFTSELYALCSIERLREGEIKIKRSSCKSRRKICYRDTLPQEVPYTIGR